SLFSQSYAVPRRLHSFPTRRSSDLTVALPTLAADFGVATSSIEWVVVGYLLSLAVWIPASGWIGDRVGTKRTLLFALGVFTVASDRKSTRLNSSHVKSSYAVFCLKK